MPKKEFTSFDVASAVLELQNTISDTRVNNIYQLDPKTFVFKLHKTNAPPIRLILEVGRRLHQTDYALEPPSMPPTFCMALRKYLRNVWLTGITQYEFERIVALHFKTKEGTMKLVLELFGEGNLILINEQNNILHALWYKRMRDRTIRRNEQFQLPPARGKNPLTLTIEELTEELKTAGDTAVVKVLARSVGVGGTYAEEILARAGIDKNLSCGALSDLQVNTVFEGLQEVLSPITQGKLEPCIVLNAEGDFDDVVPFKLKRYENAQVKDFERFNAALDEFYLKTTTVEKATAKVETDEFERDLERVNRVVAEQERLVAEAEEKYNKVMQIGNTIYAHTSEVQTLLTLFSNAKLHGKDWQSVIQQVNAAKAAGTAPFVLFESFDSKNLAINVCVDGLKFSLSIRKSIFDNAAEFYERGKKAKQKQAGALAALQTSRKQLAKAKARLADAERLKSLKPAEVLEELNQRKMKSKEWYEKFRWFTSSEDLLVVAGKDATSNEVLIKKYANPDEAVFHVEIVGSPFVVVKSDGKEPSEQTLKEAAEFAAAFSRAWREGLGSADVYWVKPEQLSKSGPSGEYVAHGSFMVNGKRNWLRGTPLRMAIGVAEDDEEDKLVYVGGPVDAVKAKTKSYVVLVPGDTTGKDLLRQVMKSLTLKLSKEQRERLGKTTIESIREFIPYTKGRIMPTR
ncbi:MAG: ribosome rescue protein RqcH [Candidatus Bathyarchaeota archaeon]|nr:ribosome rescue protein RqcH [Candidatus Bathyarchaeota archaeon]